MQALQSASKMLIQPIGHRPGHFVGQVVGWRWQRSVLQKPGNGPGGCMPIRSGCDLSERRGPPRDERYDQLRRRQHFDKFHRAAMPLCWLRTDGSVSRIWFFRNLRQGARMPALTRRAYADRIRFGTLQRAIGPGLTQTGAGLRSTTAQPDFGSRPLTASSRNN